MRTKNLLKILVEQSNMLLNHTGAKALNTKMEEPAKPKEETKPLPVRKYVSRKLMVSPS